MAGFAVDLGVQEDGQTAGLENHAIPDALSTVHFSGGKPKFSAAERHRVD